MGKTYGSRYGMRDERCEMLSQRHVKMSEGAFSAKHSRHPNKRHATKGMAKDYLINCINQGNWDRRTGDCYERTDRMGGVIKSSRGVRRARAKSATYELINEAMYNEAI